MISFLLVRLHTDFMPTYSYGDVTIVLSLMVFFNVVLSYGMETAFFRFYNNEENKKNVVETTTISIFWTVPTSIPEKRTLLPVCNPPVL